MNQGPLQYGDRIKTARKQLGISQKDLAAGLGITQASMSEIERNKIGLSLSTFEKLVYTYNINPYFLMRGEGEIFGVSSEIQVEPVSDLEQIKLTLAQLVDRVAKLENK